ncbi:MAG: hypothetical protein ACPG5F_04750, partial [Porticoccaceae bacterium]
MNDKNQQPLKALQDRDLIAQISGDQELEEHLQQSRTVYCGFDPTADSLHLMCYCTCVAAVRVLLLCVCCCCA